MLAEAPELSQLTSKLVDRGGLEPPTYRLSSGCSNQLSYQSKVLAETVGFEPTVHLKAHDGLANRYLKPLSHVSKTGGLGEFRNLDLGVKSPSLCL